MDYSEAKQATEGQRLAPPLSLPRPLTPTSSSFSTSIYLSPLNTTPTSPCALSPCWPSCPRPCPAMHHQVRRQIHEHATAGRTAYGPIHVWSLYVRHFRTTSATIPPDLPFTGVSRVSVTLRNIWPMCVCKFSTRRPQTSRDAQRSQIELCCASVVFVRCLAAFERALVALIALVALRRSVMLEAP